MLEEGPRACSSFLASLVKRVVAQLKCQKEVVSRTGELLRGRCSHSDVTRHPYGKMAIGAHHQSAPWIRWKSSSGGCASWEECHEKTSGEALSSRTL